MSKKYFFKEFTIKYTWKLPKPNCSYFNFLSFQIKKKLYSSR